MLAHNRFMGIMLTCQVDNTPTRQHKKSTRRRANLPTGQVINCEVNSLTMMVNSWNKWCNLSQLGIQWFHWYDCIVSELTIVVSDLTPLSVSSHASELTFCVGDLICCNKITQTIIHFMHKSQKSITNLEHMHRHPHTYPAPNNQLPIKPGLASWDVRTSNIK